MTADGNEGYPSREDRIVAEFGDGHDVEGIALRYGLTLAQVYAVIEREVGPADQGLPSPVQPSSPQRYAPPAAYASPGLPDDDAIVAEYGDGNDVEWIARKRGINVEQVYQVIQRIVADDPRPPAGPTSSW